VTIFIRLLREDDKEAALQQAIFKGKLDNVFQKDIEEFDKIPGAPYVYWLPTEVIEKFDQLSPLQDDDREARHGGATLDDFRFLRVWTEVKMSGTEGRWRPMLKGGAIPAFATPIYMAVNWLDGGRELKSYVSAVRDANGWGPNWTAVLNGYQYYGREGITWSARPHRRGHFAHVPPGCIFSHTGMMLFLPQEQHWAFLALTNSKPFVFLLHSLMARGTGGGQTLKYESGYVGSVPVPQFDSATTQKLGALAMRGWKVSQRAQASDETSQFFLYPGADRAFEDLSQILSEIDECCYGSYQLSETVRRVIKASFEEPDASVVSDEFSGSADDTDDECEASAVDLSDQNLSWSIGVAFGRFDWRLATGEREAPPEPEPFAPLPVKSPGMLPDDAEPFHAHSGILVEDQGHSHDLPRLIEEVLVRVQADVPGDVRRWLQRDFFPLHLKQYSKSRRKAPIYWQLAVPSGRYSAWVYAPTVTADTFFRLQQDFLAPKIADEIRTLDELSAGGRELSGKERQAAEDQEAFVAELQQMSDEVKRIAPLWKPNLDDGIILTKAPLWRLAGSHKPWQKELRAKWEELCRGDYAWAHIAMHLWPERVVPKCAEDRSLAIVHDLEDVFWLEDSSGKWRKREQPTRTIDALVRERSSEMVKAALKDLLEAPEPNPSSGRGRRKK
jgi:hypothetical protein